MKNILIFAPLAQYTPHFQTDLELALLEKEKGNKVTILSCPTQLSYICWERFKSINACLFCNAYAKQGFREVEGVCRDRLNIKRKNYDLNLRTIEDVANLEYKGLKIGQSVISTYISIYREPKVDFQKHRENLYRSCQEILLLAESMEEYLDKNHFDLVYFFNGRFMLFHPLLLLLKKRNIPFFVHERAGVLERYSLTENTYPHDLKCKKDEIQSFRNLLSPEKIKNDGTKWFNDRRGGIQQAWYSFTKDQVKGALPFKTDGRKVLSIFNSSEDEFEAISEWRNTIYKNQNDGIHQILRDIPKDVLVVIRVHPNLKNLKNSQVQGIQAFKDHANCIVIPAEALVDTYAIMEISDKVLTFGSTMGIESTFWGKPSIVAGGRSRYEDLDACYLPKNHQEVMNYINDPSLSAKPQDHCFLYGAWESNNGYQFKHFIPTGVGDGKFKGKAFALTRKDRLIFRIRNKLRKMRLLPATLPIENESL